MSAKIEKVSLDPVPRWTWIVLAVVSVGLISFHFYPPSGITTASAYPICLETAAGVKVTLAKHETEVKLNSKCRSGWVELPNDGPRYHVRITSPGALEIVFWDGRPPMLVGAKESVWEGHIKNQTFRLRGEGVAKIVLEPLSPVKPAMTVPRSKIGTKA